MPLRPLLSTVDDVDRAKRGTSARRFRRGSQKLNPVKSLDQLHRKWERNFFATVKSSAQLFLASQSEPGKAGAASSGDPNIRAELREDGKQDAWMGRALRPGEAVDWNTLQGVAPGHVVKKTTSRGKI